MALSVTPLHNSYRINAIPEKLDVAGLLSWICFKRSSKKTVMPVPQKQHEANQGSFTPGNFRQNPVSLSDAAPYIATNLETLTC